MLGETNNEEEPQAWLYPSTAWWHSKVDIVMLGAYVSFRSSFIKALQMDWTQLRLWKDSLIVLHWVYGTAHKQKMSVANRVTEVQP